MDFGSIGQRPPLLGTSSDKKSSQFGYLGVDSASERLSNPYSADLITVDEDTPFTSKRSGRYLQLNEVKNAVDTANEAVTSIYELRTRQLTLLEEAKQQSTGARIEELTTEVATLQAEIERIATSATYNNKNVILNGESFELSEPTNGVNSNVTLPALSSVLAIEPTLYPTGSSGSLLTVTQSGAEELYSYTLANVTALSGMKADVDSAAKRVNTIVENTLVPEARTPESISTVDEADKITKDIVATLGSQFATQEATKQLIDATVGKLDSERARSLLSTDTV